MCLVLTACSTTSTTSEYESTEENPLSETEEKHITQMEFSDDDEFWEYAEKTYPVTSIDEISAGSKKRETILVDGIFLGSKDENAITKKYTIGFKSEDGSYKCYSETFMPSFNNLMTDMSIMDILKQGDLIRICAFMPNGNFVDFDTMYGLKIIGYDENAVKTALNISENPLLNITEQTGAVYSGDKSKILGSRGYIFISKDILEKITSDQLMEFAQKRVQDSGYNWFSIICEDGTGICFSACDIYYPSYGKLDSDGAITEGYGDITWDFDANTYTYTERQ